MSRDVMQFRQIVDGRTTAEAPAQRALDADLQDPLEQPLQLPMQRKLAPVQRAAEPEVDEKETVQKKEAAPKLELGGGGGPSDDDPDPIQPKEDGPSGPSAPAPSAPAGGSAPSGAGKPLPEDVRAKMEAALGASFDNVRIKEDESATHLGALAFTQGETVTFAPNTYDPYSSKGQELLGHELAHVKQQRQGRVNATKQLKGGVAVNTDAGLEAEADALGARAASAQPAAAAAPAAAPAAAGPVQRKEAPSAEGPVQRKEEPSEPDVSVAPKVDFGDSAKEEGEAWEPARSARQTFVLDTPPFSVTDGTKRGFLEVFVVYDILVSNFHKVGAPAGDPGSASTVSEDAAKSAAALLDAELRPVLKRRITEEGFAAVATSNLHELGKPTVAALNNRLRPDRVWISNANIHLYEETSRASVEETRREIDEYLHGSPKDDARDAEQEPKPEESVDVEPEEKEDAERDKRETENEVKAREEGTPTPAEPPSGAEGTPIPFVTPRFEVKDGKVLRKKKVPLVVTGQAWVKATGPKAAGTVSAEALQKGRRAVASVFPGFLQSEIASKGLDAATSRDAMAQLCRMAQVMATYDTERYDLTITAIQAQVLRDESAERAFEQAEADGTIDTVEKSAPVVGADWSEDEVNGAFSIPILQLGGGVVARDLAGKASFKRKSKELKSFEGAALVAIPIGSAQVIEVKVADAKISRKGGGYEIESGTGTFTAKMPIKLFEADGWSWFIAENSTGDVKVSKNEIEEIHGAITLRARNAAGVDVFELDSSFSFAIDRQGTAKKPLEGTSTARLLVDVDLGEGYGPDGSWGAFLSKGTEAKATVAKGVLTGIDGELKAHLTQDGKRWVDLGATGHYDHATRKTTIASATAKILEDTLVGRVGEGREIFLTPTTGLTVSFEENRLTSVDGDIAMRLKVDGVDKLEGSIKGKWTPSDGIDGTGNVKLLDAYQSQVTGGMINIHAGSAGKATLKAGTIQSLEGSIEADFASVFQGQPLVMNLKGKGHYDWTKKSLLSAEGTATLTEPLMLGERVRVDTLKGSVWVKNDALIKAQAELKATFLDAQGELFSGKVTGLLDESGKLSGTATVTLLRHLDVSLGASLSARLREAAQVTATVEKGEITAIDGSLTADLLRDGEVVATLSAKGQYNVRDKVITKLVVTAKLATKISLLGDKASLDEAEGEITIEENRLTSVKGSAKVSAPTLKVDQASIEFSWRNDGTKDLYAFHGKVKWTFFQKGEQHLKGELELDYKEDGTFLATAGIDYQMAKGMGAKGKVSIDNDLEPTVHELDFSIRTTLAEADEELFKFDKTLIKLFVPILGILQLRLGIDLGAQLGMKALQLEGKFGIDSPWKLDENVTVPDFTAHLKLPWGLDLSLYLGLSLEAALDVFVAAVGIGASAGLRLNIPVILAPSLTLVGRKEGWSGAFGLALSIKPELILELAAYVFAQVILFDPLEAELGNWKIPLASFSGMDWEDEFTFGKNPALAKGKAKKEKVDPPVPAGTPEVEKPPVVNKRKEDITPPEEKDSEQAKTVALPGGGAIDGGGPLGAQKEGAKQDDGAAEGEMEGKMAKFQAALKGLQAVDVFVGFITDLGKTILTAGPLAPVMIAWEWIWGNVDFSALKKAYHDFVNGMKAAGQLLKDFASPLSFTYRLGKWLNKEIGAWDLIFGGANDAMKMYKDGLHKGKNADYKVHGSMLSAILSNTNLYVNSAEEWAVVNIMKEAEKKGHLQAAVNMVQTSTYDGTDQILVRLYGAADDEAVKIFKRNGMPWGSGPTSGHSKFDGNVQTAQIEALQKLMDSGPSNYREPLKEVYDTKGLKGAWPWAADRGLVSSATKFRNDYVQNMYKFGPTKNAKGGPPPK